MNARQFTNFTNICNTLKIPEKERYYGASSGLMLIAYENFFKISSEQMKILNTILRRIEDCEYAKKINQMLQSEFIRFNRNIELMSEEKKKEVLKNYNQQARIIRNGQIDLIINAPNIYRANIIFNLIMQGKEDLALKFSKSEPRGNLDQQISVIKNEKLIKCIIDNYATIDESLVKKINQFMIDIYNVADERLSDDNKKAVHAFIDNFADTLSLIIDKGFNENANHIIDIITSITTGVIEYTAYDKDINVFLNSIINFAQNSIAMPVNVIKQIASSIEKTMGSSIFFRKIDIILPHLQNSPNPFQVNEIMEFIRNCQNERINEIYIENVCEALRKSENKNVAKIITEIIKTIYQKYIGAKISDDIINTIFQPVLLPCNQATLDKYTEKELNLLITIFNTLIESYNELYCYDIEDRNYEEHYKNPFNTWYQENNADIEKKQSLLEDGDKYSETRKNADKLMTISIFRFIAEIMKILYGIENCKNREKKLEIILQILSNHKVSELYDINNFIETTKGIASAKSLNQCLAISNAYKKQEVFNGYKKQSCKKQSWNDNGLVKYINQVLKSGTSIPSITDVIDLFTNHKDNLFIEKKPHTLKNGEVEQPNYIIIACGRLTLHNLVRYWKDTPIGPYILENFNAGHDTEEIELDTELVHRSSAYVLCLKK